MAKAEDRAEARDLFWRRLGAGAMDIVVLGALAMLAAAALYSASGGKLRSSAPFTRTACQPLTSLSAKVLDGVGALGAARPVSAKVCAVSMAGIETSRYVSVVLEAQDGEMTRSLAFSRPVNRAGVPVTPVILDWAWPLAFILAVGLCEGLFGWTPGKRLMGLKVVAADGGRLGLPRAVLRNLVIYGGGALVLIAPLAATLAGVRLPPTGYYLAVGVFGLLVLAPFAMLAEASPRARYDRWAGSEVVRA